MRGEQRVQTRCWLVRTTRHLTLTLPRRTRRPTAPVTPPRHVHAVLVPDGRYFIMQLLESRRFRTHDARVRRRRRGSLMRRGLRRRRILRRRFPGLGALPCLDSLRRTKALGQRRRASPRRRLRVLLLRVHHLLKTCRLLSCTLTLRLTLALVIFATTTCTLGRRQHLGLLFCFNLSCIHFRSGGLDLGRRLTGQGGVPLRQRTPR